MAGNLYQRTDPRALAYEAGIVWVDHPENFEYVREGLYPCYFRRRRPGRSSCPGQMVAYAVLQRETPGGSRAFRRRIWWVAPHDPYEGGGHPTEAVDPLSIRVGKPSRLPRHAAAHA